MLHNDVVVLPVVSVVSKNLEFGVGDVPVFVGCALLQNLLVLLSLEETASALLLANNSYRNTKFLTGSWLHCRESSS